MKTKNVQSGTFSKPQKQKKNETLQMAEQWQRTFDAINSAVWILDKDQRIIQSNKTAEIYFKPKLDKIIGKQCWEVVHGTSEPIQDCPIIPALKSLKRESTKVQIGDCWYEVTVDPLLDNEGRFSGAVHIVTDITEQKLAEEALIKSEQKYRHLFDKMTSGYAVHEIICDKNRKPVDYRFLSVNPAFEKQTGLYSSAIIGRTVLEIIPDLEPIWIERYGKVALTREPIQFESYTKALDKTFEIRAFSPEHGKFATIFNDISDRKHIETRLNKLNRIYAVLSNVNQMIMRINEPLELFQTACNIAVKDGGFRMVWIGLLDEETKQVKPVAHAGATNGYLKKININLDDSKRSLGPTATALKAGKYSVVNDIANDPRMVPWRDDALQLGYRSSAAFPLIVEGKVSGTINLYAPEPDFFDDEELKLLEEMAGDISFSLEYTEHKKKNKQAEKNLQQSEARLKSAQQLAKIGNWELNLKTNELTWSDEIFRIFEIDQQLFRANYEAFLELIHPDDRELINGIYTRSLKNKSNYSIEHRLLMKDGRIKYVHEQCETSFDADGNPLVSLGTIQDITERKQAEEKLRHSEAFLNNIIDQNPYGYWVSDDKGTLIRINQACCELLNINESDVVGKYNVFKDNIVKEQGMLPLVQSVFTKGETVRFEIDYNTSKLKNVKLQGQASVILDTTVFPIKDTNGKVINAVIQHVNITGRKQTETELQKYHEHLEELVKERTIKLEKANIELQSEINERKRIEEELARERNMLKTLIDNIPDEIYAKDKESRFILANSHVIKSLWKNKPEDVIGKTDFDVLPHEQALKYYNDEQDLLKSNEQMINYETSRREEDGYTHWYSITKVPLKDNENKISGLVGINRDITMFKIAEESHRRAKEAAVAANIAKSTFLSSMSHEIRTPLNAVLGFSQLMLNDENLTIDQKEYLETINKSGEHLLTLINDILEISKIEAGRAVFTPSVFNLYSIINDIETMFRIKTDSKQLSLLVEYPEDLPNFIVTDEGKLRQILINIVGNAVKFTDEGGIAIRVRTDDIENGKAVLIIEVEDTGCGISEKDNQKLFNMFGQTESGVKEGGTGLGLVISREYARMMGGDITVKSEINSGSCFTIKISIEKNLEVLPVQKARKKRVIGIEPGQKYKVLIVDDQSDNRALLNKILSSVGFELNEANNGKEAVEKYKSWSPDIIIMDMRMPVMDGYEATRNIKEIDKKIPIIAVTASAFYEDRVKALEAGADKYLRKPFKGDELLDHMKTYLGVKYIYENDKGSSKN